MAFSESDKQHHIFRDGNTAGWVDGWHIGQATNKSGTQRVCARATSLLIMPLDDDEYSDSESCSTNA